MHEEFHFFEIKYFANKEVALEKERFAIAFIS
jgi:hypothetical protein